MKHHFRRYYYIVKFVQYMDLSAIKDLYATYNTAPINISGKLLVCERPIRNLNLGEH